MSSTGGSTAVEFGLIAIPFIGILVAIIQLGVVCLAQQELETAVEKTARTLLTGSAQTSNLTQSQFAASVCANLPALFTCNKVMIDLRSATSFSSADTSTPTLTYDSNGNVTNTWSYTPGASGSIMVLRVLYQFPVVPMPLGMKLANLSNNTRLLMATAVFQAEPFGS